MTSTFIIYNEWEGGIPAGSLNYFKNAYIVRFADGERKTFNENKYDNAKELAEKWKTQKSLEKGLTRNQYRLVECDIEGNYYEVQLQDNKISKIDIQDLHLLGNTYTWSFFGKGTRVYMAISERSDQDFIFFHRLLFPEYPYIDHINRDGLDNRRRNLRNVTIKENNENQQKRTDNHSGKTGVHHSKYANAWVSQWTDSDGKRMKKRFGCKRYGYDGAKLLAINYRQTMDVENNVKNGYDSDGDTKLDITPIDVTKVKERPRDVSTNTSGTTNVSFNKKCGYWVRTWQVDGKRKSKTFSLKTYGDDAKQMAITFSVS